MKYLIVGIGILLSPLTVQAADSQINPFTSDGCSAFADRSMIPSGPSWAHCCVAHDLTYWRGGEKWERNKADKDLVACVNQSLNTPSWNPFSLGWVMWLGVKFGGAPYQKLGGNPFPWRWGYGWTDKSRYKALNDGDREDVLRGLRRVYASLPQIARDVDLDAAQVAYVEQALREQILELESRLYQAM